MVGDNSIRRNRSTLLSGLKTSHQGAEENWIKGLILTVEQLKLWQSSWGIKNSQDQSFILVLKLHRATQAPVLRHQLISGHRPGWIWQSEPYMH